MLFLAVMALVVLSGLLYQWAGERRDANRYPPPGRFVKGLHVYETGRLGPTLRITVLGIR